MRLTAEYVRRGLELALATARGLKGGPGRSVRVLELQLDFLERTGHFSRRMVSTAIHYMVRTCALCGARALYRYGTDGRCRAHRDVRTAGFERRRRGFEARSEDIGGAAAASDGRLLRAETVRKYAKQVRTTMGLRPRGRYG